MKFTKFVTFYFYLFFYFFLFFLFSFLFFKRILVNQYVTSPFLSSKHNPGPVNHRGESQEIEILHHNGGCTITTLPIYTNLYILRIVDTECV